MIYCLFAHTSWILNYVPLLPMSPVKLFLGLWVLMPAYSGETVVYLILTDHLANFEAQIAHYYSEAISRFLTTVITWSHDWSLQNRSCVNEETLPKLRKLSEEMNLAFV